MDKDLFIFYSTPSHREDGCLAYDCILKLKQCGIVKPGDCRCKTDNKDSLAKTYNDILRDPCVSGKILVLIHSDLKIDDIFVKEKLNERFNRNKNAGVVGIAGGGKIADRPQSHQLWHLITPRETWMGEVSGNKTSDILSPIITTRFGLQGNRAIIIDGCFMALDVDRVREKGVLFDEDSPSKYNFYDLMFSLRCYWAGIEVYVDSIHVVHTSPGLTNVTDDFIVGDSYFREKYLSKLWS